jgi:hypothetical protein
MGSRRINIDTTAPGLLQMTAELLGDSCISFLAQIL